MKVSRGFVRTSLIALFLLLMVGIFVGCQKKEEGKQAAAQQMEGQQKLATYDNIQTAYASEVKCVAWYDRFARQAQKENLGEIAVLFKALSRSEQVHVANIAAFLKSKNIEPVQPQVDSIAAGKARQYLKLSLSNENVEQSTLASFQAKAEEEKVADAVELFRRMGEADARHGRLLKKAIDQESNFARLPYLMCPECGYIVGSDKMEECPVCKTKKDKFEKI